jgi:hypothetical protein
MKLRRGIGDPEISTLEDFARLIGIETQKLQGLLEQEPPFGWRSICGAFGATRDTAPRSKVPASRHQSRR